MSNNKQNIEEILDDGELTMEELDRIAGGEGRAIFDPNATMPLPSGTDAQLDVFKADIQTTPTMTATPFDVQVTTPPVHAGKDSSYTSFLGAEGTGPSGNFNGHMKHQPMNMTSRFP